MPNRFSAALILAATTALLTGCGDTVAQEKFCVTQLSGLAPYQVEIAPSLEKDRSQHIYYNGDSVTEIRLATNKPIKIIIVPATQP